MLIYEDGAFLADTVDLGRCCADAGTLTNVTATNDAHTPSQMRLIIVTPRFVPTARDGPAAFAQTCICAKFSRQHDVVKSRSVQLDAKCFVFSPGWRAPRLSASGRTEVQQWTRTGF